MLTQQEIDDLIKKLEKECNNMKCKWGNDEFIVEIGSLHQGLFCSKCGKWIKWISKKEIKDLKRIDKIVKEVTL